MIRFVSLGSGSKGNALLVHAGTTRVLIDCGFGVRALAERLARVGVVPEQLDAVFVTHEHSDHVAGLAALQRRTGCPIYATAGTLDAVSRRQRLIGSQRRIKRGVSVAIGDLLIHPYEVPHDAAEPVQFVISDGAARLGVLTDAGRVTDHMFDALSGCEGLVLEFNHDLAMLRGGPYPHFLKQRIAGEYGHLDNDMAADLLARLAHTRLQQVLGAHLSEQNNRPALVCAAMAGALGARASEMRLASQQAGSDWLVVGG